MKLLPSSRRAATPQRWRPFGFRTILAIALLVAVIFAASFNSPSEPRYEGRPLSEWFRSSELQAKDGFGYSLLNPEGVAAIRHIGAAGIPFYLRWIQANPFAARMAGNPPNWMPNWLQKISVSFYQPSEDRIRYAVMGFRTLGTNAADAIPALSKMMLVRRGGVPVGFSARFALAYLGKDALVPLAAALTNPPSWNQIGIPMAIGGMTYLGSEARPVIPILVRSTTNPILSVQAEAACALGSFRMDPDISIPALTNSLRSRAPEARTWAAWALGEFGPQAQATAPLLVQALHDPDRQVRGSAYAALQKVAPDWFPPKNQAGQTPYIPMDQWLERFQATPAVE